MGNNMREKVVTFSANMQHKKFDHESSPGTDEDKSG